MRDREAPFSTLILATQSMFSFMTSLIGETRERPHAARLGRRSMLGELMAEPTLKDLPPRDAPSDQILTAFLEYVGTRGLELDPAQEEAILELFEGANVILNTPTGSGKSLVAEAAPAAPARRSPYAS